MEDLFVMNCPGSSGARILLVFSIGLLRGKSGLRCLCVSGCLTRLLDDVDLEDGIALSWSCFISQQQFTV